MRTSPGRREGMTSGYFRVPPKSRNWPEAVRWSAVTRVSTDRLGRGDLNERRPPPVPEGQATPGFSAAVWVYRSAQAKWFLSARGGAAYSKSRVLDESVVIPVPGMGNRGIHHTTLCARMSSAVRPLRSAVTLRRNMRSSFLIKRSIAL